MVMVLAMEMDEVDGEEGIGVVGGGGGRGWWH